MWTDFLLAAAHHVLVFALFSILAVEIVYAKPGLSADAIRRLGKIDMLYGLVSTLVIVVGFSRAIWGLKGWDYYEGNILFWVKIGLFLTVGALSAMPTIAFLKWNARLRANPADLPSDAEVKANRKWLHMESTVIILIPIVAAALARGMTD
ncbi:MAG: DUF2214 family protein [Micropepsaceae bacterium]